MAAVVGVDPRAVAATFRGAPLEVHADLADALAGVADLVIVATPTASHAAVVTAVREVDPDVAILLEKPAADRAPDAERVLATPGVEVILHSAFAPEVLWASRLHDPGKAGPGDVVSAEALFGNPYAQDEPERAASLANSWLDSGINALSVIGRFAIPTGVTSFREFPDHASTFEARLGLGGDDPRRAATILTTWQVADYSQWVRLRFAGGAELVLDDMAGTATLLEEGAVAAMYTRDAGVARLTQHYANFYADYFGERRFQYPTGRGARTPRPPLRGTGPARRLAARPHRPDARQTGSGTFPTTAASPSPSTSCR